MSETFEQAIERCLMDGTTAKALRLIAASLDDASDDCIDAIAIRQGADGLDTLVARVADLAASRDRASDACATVQRERDEAREEVERLRKLVAPQWFYYGDECSSDRCRDSIHECIDEDFLYDNRGEGSHVLEIATATNLPTIWAVVHFFTDEEKDARQSDDDYEIVEFATEAEAKAFLARYEASK